LWGRRGEFVLLSLLTSTRQRAKNEPATTATTSERRATASEDRQRAKSDSERATTANEGRRQNVRNRQFARSANALTDEPTPHITLSKKKSNLTSRRGVVLNCSDGQEDNKEVATNCGESVGEGGEIPFSDDSSKKKYEFLLGQKKFVLSIPAQDSTDYCRVEKEAYDILRSTHGHPRPYVLLLCGRRPYERSKGLRTPDATTNKKYKFSLGPARFVPFHSPYGLSLADTRSYG